MESKNSAVEEAKRYTDAKIRLLRNRLPAIMKNDCVSVVAVGSFGRKEASDLSDLDFFFIKDSEDYAPDAEVEAFRGLFGELEIRTPSKDGAFNSEIELCSDMSRNIGGFEDSQRN